jgi:hypothetical protein
MDNTIGVSSPAASQAARVTPSVEVKTMFADEAVIVDGQNITLPDTHLLAGRWDALTARPGNISRIRTCEVSFVDRDVAGLMLSEILICISGNALMKLPRYSTMPALPVGVQNRVTPSDQHLRSESTSQSELVARPA